MAPNLYKASTEAMVDLEKMRRAPRSINKEPPKKEARTAPPAGRAGTALVGAPAERTTVLVDAGRTLCGAGPFNAQFTAIDTFSKTIELNPTSLPQENAETL